MDRDLLGNWFTDNLSKRIYETNHHNDPDMVTQAAWYNWPAPDIDKQSPDQ